MCSDIRLFHIAMQFLYNTVHELNTAETWTPESQNDLSFIK